MSLFPFMTTCFVYIIARFFGWKWVKDRYTLNENRIRFRFIIGVVFKLVSKAIRNWTGFALLWSVIGPKNSLHPLDQSDVKLKPFTSWSPTRFLPALWAVIWFTKVFSFWLALVITLGLVLRHWIEKRSTKKSIGWLVNLLFLLTLRIHVTGTNIYLVLFSYHQPSRYLTHSWIIWRICVIFGSFILNIFLMSVWEGVSLFLPWICLWQLFNS